MSDPSKRAWLVTGRSGQVGGALVPPPGVRIVAPQRTELDLTDPKLEIAELIRSEQITAIINCAAYTQVDRAEAEPSLAMQINGVAPGLIACAAADADVPLIHLSTDYVFSGDQEGWHRETDRPAPGTSYGRSKLAGEEAIANSGARHAIIRTSWVFGARGHNFLKTILRLGNERDEVAVVDDQWGCPTHAGDLANALAMITGALEAGVRQNGIWHVANAGATSWHGFAWRILTTAERFGRAMPALHPIPTRDYPTAAPRPANSRLSTDKALEDFGVRLRPWEEATDEVVAAICHPGGQ